MVAEHCLARPDLELATGIVHSPAKVGHDIGTLIGVDPIGVTASDDVAAVAASSQVDVLIYCGLGDAAEVAEIFGNFVDQGKDCVTVTGLIHPETALGAEAARELHIRAVRGGGGIVGVGWNPGFLLDLLPVTLAQSIEGLRSVTARRISDLSTWGWGLLSRLGVGNEPVPGGPSGWEEQLPLRESLHLVADALGTAIEAEELSYQAIVAEQTYSSGDMEIASGQVRGFDVELSGSGEESGGRDLEITLRWTGVHGLDRYGDPELVDSARVEIQGEAGLEAVIGGTILDDPFPATAARAVNVIAPLRQMPAGLYRPDQIAPTASGLGPGNTVEETTWAIE